MYRITKTCTGVADGAGNFHLNIASRNPVMLVVSCPIRYQMTQPSGKPNLAQYNQSLRHYTSQYEDAIAVLNSAQLGDATEAYHQRVEAT